MFGKIFILLSLLSILSCQQETNEGENSSSQPSEISCHDNFPFEGGAGSKDNPYKICSAKQFLRMRDYLQDHFVLISDIDFSKISEEEFSPIGQASYVCGGCSPFVGSLNGKNYRLKNLTIASSDIMEFALFGSVGSQPDTEMRSEIKNLFIENFHITSNSQAPALLVGSAYNADLSNIYIKNSSVTMTSSSFGWTGCLVSHFSNSNFNNGAIDCNIDGSTLFNVGLAFGRIQETSVVKKLKIKGSISIDSASANIGGLAGMFINTVTLDQISVDVNIYAPNASWVGGLVGFSNEWSGGTKSISNAYVKGNITGKEIVGGFIGDADETDFSHVFTLANVSYSLGGNTENGGFAGKMCNGTVNSAFYSNNIAFSDCGEAKTDNQMKQATTFAGWGSKWKITDGSYPRLSFE